MSEAAKLREEICLLARSMFDRGLTCGASGNISARLSDGTILVTPTGSSMGFLDPARISHLDAFPSTSCQRIRERIQRIGWLPDQSPTTAKSA